MKVVLSRHTGGCALQLKNIHAKLVITVVEEGIQFDIQTEDKLTLGEFDMRSVKSYVGEYTTSKIDFSTPAGSSPAMEFGEIEKMAISFNLEGTKVSVEIS